MNKLIYANWKRLTSEKSTWIVLISMFLGGAVIALLMYVLSDNESVRFLDSPFFAYVNILGFVISGFTAMFLGTEYADGTMRNKVVIGNSRVQIYLANFIICTIASIGFTAAWMAGAFVVGFPLLGTFDLPAIAVVTYVLNTLFVIISFTAIFCLISMLVTNKARAVLVCVVISLVLFFAGTIFFEMLQAPEFISMYELSVDGTPVANEVPNAHYLRGIKRDIVQTILDVIPSGQCVQVSTFSAPHPVLMCLYSVLVALVANITGCCVFRKKDLK